MKADDYHDLRHLVIAYLVKKRHNTAIRQPPDGLPEGGTD